MINSRRKGLELALRQVNGERLVDFGFRVAPQDLQCMRDDFIEFRGARKMRKVTLALRRMIPSRIHPLIYARLYIKMRVKCKVHLYHELYFPI